MIGQLRLISDKWSPTSDTFQGARKKWPVKSNPWSQNRFEGFSCHRAVIRAGSHVGSTYVLVVTTVSPLPAAHLLGCWFPDPHLADNNTKIQLCSTQSCCYSMLPVIYVKETCRQDPNCIWILYQQFKRSHFCIY